MSLLGNFVVIGTTLTCIAVPQMLRKLAPALVLREGWWGLLPAALAVLIYMVSLRTASAVFPGRRERLLAVVEGKA